MRKSRDWTREIAISPQFLAIEPRFVRKGCDWTLASRNFTSVFGDRTSFHVKESRLDKRNCNFTAVFGDRTSFRAKGLRLDPYKSQFHLSFWRSNLVSCERVAPDDLQVAISPQFLAIELHFVRKGCAGQVEIAILP